MRKRRSILGTQVAYIKCGTCGHTKMRHGFRGTGACTFTRYRAPEGATDPKDIETVTCQCGRFIDPKDVTPCPTNARPTNAPTLW